MYKANPSLILTTIRENWVWFLYLCLVDGTSRVHVLVTLPSSVVLYLLPVNRSQKQVELIQQCSKENLVEQPSLDLWCPRLVGGFKIPRTTAWIFTKHCENSCGTWAWLTVAAWPSGLALECLVNGTERALVSSLCLTDCVLKQVAYLPVPSSCNQSERLRQVQWFQWRQEGKLSELVEEEKMVFQKHSQ